MATVTTTELRENLSAYITLSQTEDVFIKRNGVIVSTLRAYSENRKEKVRRLRGVMEGNELSLEDARKERLDRV